MYVFNSVYVRIYAINTLIFSDTRDFFIILFEIHPSKSNR